MTKLDYQRSDLVTRRRDLATVSGALAIVAVFFVSLLFVIADIESPFQPVAVVIIWGAGFGAPLAGIVVAVVGIALRDSNRTKSALALILNIAAFIYTIAVAYHFTD